MSLLLRIWDCPAQRYTLILKIFHHLYIIPVVVLSLGSLPGCMNLFPLLLRRSVNLTNDVVLYTVVVRVYLCLRVIR